MVAEKRCVPQVHVAALGSLLEFAICQLPRMLPRLVTTGLRGDRLLPRQEAAAHNYGVTCNLWSVVSHKDNVAQSSPVVQPHFQNAVTNQIPIRSVSTLQFQHHSLMMFLRKVQNLFNYCQEEKKKLTRMPKHKATNHRRLYLAFRYNRNNKKLNSACYLFI